MRTYFKNRLLVAVALLSTFAAFNAKGDIFTSCGVDLGAAGRTTHWAVLTLGGSFIADISPNSDYEGQSRVFGNVGVAGQSNMKMGGGAGVIGDIYLHSMSTLTVNDGAFYTGSVFQNVATDNLLDQAVSDAQSASDFANNLPTSPGYPSTINTGQSMTLVASGTCTVLRLTDFVLTGGVFTLQGTAGQAFIINVSNNFSLKGGASVVLSGGLQPADVLFNIRGRGNVVNFDQASSLTGIILATQRMVKLKNYSIITGEVIANSLNIGSHSQIISQGDNP